MGEAEEESESAPQVVVEASDEDEVGIRPPDSKGGGGAPMWIVTFADLSTLMLTFFVLLLSFANTDIVMFENVMGGIQEAFGVTKAEQGMYQLVAEEGAVPDKSGKIKMVVDKKKMEQRALAQQMADIAKRSNMRNNVRIQYQKDGIDVRVEGGVMFKPASAELKKGMKVFLQGVANVMKSFNFNLLIEGHTDNVSIRTKQFPSNWELSTVRATTTLRELIKLGTPADRMAAVGMADRKPVRDNDTPANRALNRRVEFKFIRVES